MRSQLLPDRRPKARVGELERFVIRGWMRQSRWAAFLPHAPRGLSPGRNLGAFACPMDDGGFVAPVNEARHRVPVGAGPAIVAHGFLGLPGRECPERSFRIN